MTRQTVDLGQIPGDGTGDTARAAFDKCNDNFDELYNRQVIAGVGLSGGGSLTADRILTVELKQLTTDGTGGASLDHLVFTDASDVDTTKRVAVSDFLANTGLATASFSNIEVAGQDEIIAEVPNDTLTIAAGSNITITTDAGTDTVTIAASGSLGYSVIQEEGSNLTARTNLNFVGAGLTAVDDTTRTNVTLATTLNLLAALTAVADKGVYFTAGPTAALFDLTAAGRALLDDANAAAQLVTLGIAYASQAEVQTGTATDRIVSPATLTPLEFIAIPCSDQTTAITAAADKMTFRMPYAFKLRASPLGVRASCKTAPTGANLVIDINESGTTILSTKLSIDATEKTSTTATTPAVISDVNLADDAEITIDFDTVGSTISGVGVIVTLIGWQVP